MPARNDVSLDDALHQIHSAHGACLGDAACIDAHGFRARVTALTGRSLAGGRGRDAPCVERFEDMPCIIGSNPSYTDPDAPAAPRGQYQHQIVAVDKRTGVLKFYKSNLQQNGPFQALNFDPKVGSFEFWNYNLRVKIAAE